MPRYIELTQGYEALVDNADYEQLSKYSWHYDRGYAARTIPGVGIEYMHRMVNKTPKGLQTDHINHNKLDNRQENLRTCDTSQNHLNNPTRTDNTSGHKGVVWHKRNQKWQAQLGINGKCKYLGQYEQLEDAIRAYAQAAKRHYGEFAYVSV